jgi:OOP family OmpA-OmpF porin
MKGMKSINATILLSSSLLWYGCSSAPRGEIAGTANPTDEITKLESDILTAEKKGYEVLDSENFNKSKKYLSEAKEGLKDNDDQKDILDDLRISKGYFEKAEKNFNERRAKLEPVLVTRNQALIAGIEKYPKFENKWKEAEEEMKTLSTKNSNDIDSTELKDLEARYSELELDAIKAQYLSVAETTITNAKEKNAESKAPKSLKQAQTTYDAAVSKISANRNSPEFFNSDVIKANYQATILDNVMGYVKDDKYSEQAAIELVHQKEKIGMLDNRVAAQGDQLAQTESQLALKDALDIASKQFKKSEADVYQQGNNLIIRLKAINFATGQAALPANATPLLRKVEMVAEGLDAKKVVVQGHTDSVGSKTVNQKLSMERAKTVATYLEQNGFNEAEIKVEGYGDTKPLTNNKTAENKAQNRRIDIVITPSSSL